MPLGVHDGGQMCPHLVAPPPLGGGRTRLCPPNFTVPTTSPWLTPRGYSSHTIDPRSSCPFPSATLSALPFSLLPHLPLLLLAAGFAAVLGEGDVFTAPFTSSTSSLDEKAVLLLKELLLLLFLLLFSSCRGTCSGASRRSGSRPQNVFLGSTCTAKRGSHSGMRERVRAKSSRQSNLNVCGFAPS